MVPFPVASEERLALHVELYLDSFARLVGRELVARRSRSADLRTLFDAPFVAVSHGTESDPIFDFGNRAALELWEFSFEEFVHLPSRYSAEPGDRDERERLLSSVRERGYSTDYAGVRASRSGRRFRIEGVTVWNLVDGLGIFRGQGATFERFVWL